MSRGELTSVLKSGPAMVVTTLVALSIVAGIGWKARDAMGATEAAQTPQMAKDIEILKLNVARIMDRLNIPQEPVLPPTRGH